jgi:hypothetical protein
MATQNPYSDSLLMDALRGSLSNAESLGRGFAVAPVGLLGDINALARQYVTPRLPQNVQGLLQSAPAAPTTEQILSNIPRVSNQRMETAGMEQLGAAMNPRGPVDLARGVGRVAGNAINEAMVYDRGLLSGITPQPMRMDVWHGSPHIFNKFDAAKIGTGEGAQMYGQGTYLAQQQEVAKRFTPRDTNFEDALMKKYNQAEKSGDYASMQVYEDFLTQKTPEEIAASMADMGFSGKDLDSANKAFESAKKLYQGQTKGALYKVNLPDESIAKMIDWDAPIKDQPSNIQGLAEKYGVDLTDLGGDLAFKIGKTAEGQKIMQEQGITGVKYFDQMSRGDQNNARNFVVFDPNELNILERNAMPIEGLLGR